MDMTEVNVNDYDNLLGETALSAAAQGGYRHACELLLEREASVLVPNKKGNSSLINAVKVCD